MDEFKQLKNKREKELGRPLTKDEEMILHDDWIGGVWEEATIPSEEISDLEIAGLKD